jgi:hypothetical protein
MKLVNPLRVFVCTGALLFALAVPALTQAETILKLNLGADSTADIEFDGTDLSTISDGIGATTGDQNTTVDFLGFLGVVVPNPMSDASFTLSDVAVSGPATVLGGSIVSQSFLGGDFFLYDDLNALLLSGTLDESELFGPLGGSATGALFTTTLGSVSGGSLAGLIDLNSISLSISMTAINGSTGFSVTGDALDSFSTDVTLNIAAQPREIPEPAAATLGLVGGLLLSFAFRRRA